MEQGEERWAPIPERDGYDASDWGQIRSWRVQGGRRSEPRIRKPQPIGKGYLEVIFGRALGREYVHRLVLFTFVGPCPPGMESRHKDGNRRNNRLDNLEWASPLDNQADKIAHGTMNAYPMPVDPEPFYFTDPFIPVEALDLREYWKEISWADGYEISSFGRVGSYWGKGRNAPGVERSILKPRQHQSGHFYVVLLATDRSSVTRGIHRLVIEAFSPQVEASHECRHLNGISSDNRIGNLRWCTHLENMRDRTLHGTDNRGERAANAKLTEVQVIDIYRRRMEGPSKLAREYNVNPNTIVGIHKRRRWKHVTDRIIAEAD
jgi:hypothetical protein